VQSSSLGPGLVWQAMWVQPQRLCKVTQAKRTATQKLTLSHPTPKEEKRGIVPFGGKRDKFLCGRARGVACALACSLASLWMNNTSFALWHHSRQIYSPTSPLTSFITMGAYKYLEEVWRKKQSDAVRFLLRVR
jgi:hypothetical protein